MRRLLIALAALVVILAAGLALLPRLVSPQTIQSEVARHTSQMTGLDVRIDGETTFSFWPSIGFDIENVSLAAPGNDTPIAVMDELDGTVEILPLLQGRVVVSSFRLVRPRITLRRTATGEANWQGGGAARGEPGAGGSRPDRPVLGGVRIGVVEIREGTVAYQDGAGGELNLTGITGSFAWPDPQAPATASGSFIWNGSTVGFNVRATDLVGLFGSGQSGLVAALNSTLGELKLNGSANTKAEFQFNGTAELRSGKARALLSWLNAGTIAGLADFAMTGNLNLVGSNAAFSNLRMRVDGTNAEGALKIGRAAGVTSVQGTLAIDAIDLGRYRQASPEAVPAQPTQAAQRERTLDLSPLNAFDIDLRLSAGTVKLGKAAIGGAAVSVTAREGRFQIAVGEADIFGGKASGTLSGTATAGGRLPMTTSLQAKGLQAGPVLDALGLPPRLTGTIDANLGADGDGASLARFQRSMTGQAKINIANATITGVDLRRAVELLLDPAKAAQGSAGSQTALSNIGGSFVIRDGVSSTSDLVLSGNQLKIGLSGSHDIPTGALDAQGLAEIGAPGQNGQAPVAVPFRLGGTIDAPRITPDTAWLLDLNKPENREQLRDNARTLLRTGIEKLLERSQPPR